MGDGGVRRGGRCITRLVFLFVGCRVGVGGLVCIMDVKLREFVIGVQYGREAQGICNFSLS